MYLILNQLMDARFVHIVAWLGTACIVLSMQMYAASLALQVIIVLGRERSAVYCVWTSSRSLCSIVIEYLKSLINLQTFMHAELTTMLQLVAINISAKRGDYDGDARRWL